MFTFQATKSLRHFAAVLAIGAASSAFAEAPPAGTVTFSAPHSAGDGCPAGSTAINVSPDQQAFTILFDSFFLEGGSRGNPNATKGCITDVDVDVPAGWSFQVITVDTRGYASLATRDVHLAIGSRVSVGNNNGAAANGALRLRGPYDDAFQVRATVNGGGRGRWSACGTVRHRVRIDSTITLHRDGVAAVDSLDSQVQALALEWVRCR